MSFRNILSARTAKPQVEALLSNLVGAAVYIGRADGRFNEDELETFIDTMREVVSAAVGDEFLEAYASAPVLLDGARAARTRLLRDGNVVYLRELAHSFNPAFACDGLVLAYRVVMADGRVTENEATAFQELSSALGLEVQESQLLRELAAGWEASSRLGAKGLSVEQFRAMEQAGWTPIDPESFDAALEHVQHPTTRRVRLELDARESVLHIRLLDSGGVGPRVVCLFADQLPAVLTVLHAMRDTLLPDTLHSKLPALHALGVRLFVEREGRFSAV